MNRILLFNDLQQGTNLVEIQKKYKEIYEREENHNNHNYLQYSFITFNTITFMIVITYLLYKYYKKYRKTGISLRSHSFDYIPPIEMCKLKRIPTAPQEIPFTSTTM